MKRILIVGCGGAGKSTLARHLGERLAIPVIHLDMHFWQPGWIETERDQWRSKVANLCQQEQWIMDGNFGETADIRYAAADTIVFLDPPRLVCLTRWFKRFIQFRNGGRPDMTEGCKEKIDLEYLKWIWNFQKNSRPKVLARIQQYASKNTRTFHLKTDRNVKEFLNSAIKSHQTLPIEL